MTGAIPPGLSAAAPCRNTVTGICSNFTHARFVAKQRSLILSHMIDFRQVLFDELEQVKQRNLPSYVENFICQFKLAAAQCNALAAN